MFSLVTEMVYVTAVKATGCNSRKIISQIILPPPSSYRGIYLIVV